MKLMSLIATLTATLAATPSVYAAPITVNLAGAVNTSFASSQNFWPIGTSVSATITFDIGPGIPLQASIGAASGGASWMIGSVPHSLTLTGLANNSFLAFDGTYELAFAASAPLDPGILAFEFWGNLGVNPFTTSAQLHDLVLASAIGGFGLFALENGGGFGDSDLVDGPSFGIRAVPEPATLSLFGAGLIGLWTRRRTPDWGRPARR